MFSPISRKDDPAVFEKNKDVVLKEADIGKLEGRPYLQSDLRAWLDGSNKLYIRKPPKEKFVKPDQKVSEVSTLRRVPSGEERDYSSSDENPEKDDVPLIEGELKKTTDPRYRNLKKTFLDLGPMVFSLPKTVENAKKIPCPSECCLRTPRGVVKVYKGCAIDVKKTSLKVDNVQISKICQPQVGNECPNTMQIDINRHLSSKCENVRRYIQSNGNRFKSLRTENRPQQEVVVNMAHEAPNSLPPAKKAKHEGNLTVLKKNPGIEEIHYSLGHEEFRNVLRKISSLTKDADVMDSKKREPAKIVVCRKCKKRNVACCQSTNHVKGILSQQVFQSDQSAKLDQLPSIMKKASHPKKEVKRVQIVASDPNLTKHPEGDSFPPSPSLDNFYNNIMDVIIKMSGTVQSE